MFKTVNKDVWVFDVEWERVRNLLSTEGTLPGKEHLFEFLETWKMTSTPDQKE